MKSCHGSVTLNGFWQSWALLAMLLELLRPLLKVEKRTMCTVFNSGNSHVADHTSLQNLVSVSGA
jgi:hypothetical protein